MRNKRLFKKNIWNYYRAHGRNLLWRQTKNPYRIVISEVMLQQTQVSRVIPKYTEFIKKFPSFRSLANTPLRDIFRVWQGLGYNRRAVALQKLAKIVVRDYSGILPDEPAELEKLPGIGKATAGSICAFAFNKPVPFIETNIRRVFIHFFFPKKKQVNDAEILKLVEQTLDKKKPRLWYYALMDYGAEKLKDIPNPNRRSAHYAKQSPFKGSPRELRGRIIAFLTKRKKASVSQLSKELGVLKDKLADSVDKLASEGLLKKQKDMVRL